MSRRFPICPIYGLILAVAAPMAQAATPNLLHHPQSLGADGWTLELRDKAAGSAQIDPNLGRSAKGAIKLTKTNPVGAVLLKTAAPIQVKKGVEYTFRGYFHSDNAPLSALLLFRVTDNLDRIQYDAINRSAGVTSQSLLVNSPSGQWLKRVVNFKPEKDQTVWPVIVLWGNPATVWLDDLQFTDERYVVTPNDGTLPPPPLSQAQTLSQLAQRSPTTARIELRGGQNVLLINDKPVPPAMYKANPSRVASSTYAAFHDAGIDLATVTLPLGMVRGKPGVWQGRDKYDFKRIDQIMLEVLQRNPQANLIVDFNIYPYPAWGDEHPDQCWTDKQGRRAYGLWGNIEGFTDDLKKVNSSRNRYWWYASYQSPVFRRDAARAMTAIIDHLKTTPYWNAVAGFFMSGGHDGQWITLMHADYSKPTLAAFRQWCRQRYGTIEKLNQAWGTKYSSFDEVSVILTTASGNMESAKPYIDRGGESDYRLFMTDSVWDLIDGFAAACKQAAGKPVIAMAYAGATLGPDRPAPVALAKPNVDVYGSMSYYPFRLPGYSPGFRPISMQRLPGKLFFQEMDLRSWVGSQYAEVYNLWISSGRTPDQWDAIHRKLLGVSLATGSGWWYYDMNRYYNDPILQKQIARTAHFAADYVAQPHPKFRPDVAVVVGDAPMLTIGPKYSPIVNGPAADLQTMQLETSGVPYDLHYLSDVLARPDLQQYKVYVFLHSPYISTQQRRAIQQKLENNGRTLVWVGGSGYVSEQGKSAQAMSDLIGMHIDTTEEYARLTALVDSAADSPLVRNVASYQGMSELYLTILSLQGRSSFCARYQPFWIDDAAATPLAHYAQNGRTAAAVKRMDGWTSIYLAAPNSLGADLLNNIARSAGAFRLADAGQSIVTNGSFASVHGMRSGPLTLQLPPGCHRVRDALTGKVEARNVDHWTFNVIPGQTYWFLFD